MDVNQYTPISAVKVLHNVPIDNSYTDTLDFSDVSAQTSYFVSKVKFSNNNVTPIRLQNVMRLPYPADSLYDCNYIMFQNANYGMKWFYAFITEIKFININMCELAFEIDIFQTWQFDIDFKPSLIEREHSLTDNIGDNLIVENIDIGPYRDETAQSTSYFNSYVAVIATAYDAQSSSNGGYVGGMFTGLKYIAGLVDNDEEVQTLVSFLESAVEANKADAIVSIFMMPTKFYTDGTAPATERFDASMQTSHIGNYTPKNKKLLTYPYNFLYVYGTDGNSAIYRYEYFQSNDTCGFVLECAMSCNPEIVLEPIAYNNQQFNIDEALTMTGFPQCSFVVDAFKAWLAQSASTTALSTIGSVGSLAFGAISGNPLAVGAGAMGLASSVNSVVLASAKPPQSRGSQGNSTFVGTREKNFYFVNKHITEDYARIIDDYFEMYGYATNRIKVPNLKGRPFWNYVKTNGAKILGSIPFGDLSKLKEIFDKGITIWHGDWVGNYTLNNHSGV